MSNIYSLEPPTRGKVTLKTSLGDIDIELWSKEAPKACRNFVQLCMEGYYNNTVFHRAVKDFIVQGGDPTGSGKGGESIYGQPFEDEFHSRLQFRRRALVACANENGKPNSNGSQFFFTLSRCDWLTKKHTIFGAITGDTVYNLMKFNDLEVGEDDRPVDPPTLTSATIIWNPFEDIVPRKSAEDAKPEAKQAAKDNRGRVRNVNLLSFGDDEMEGDDEGLSFPSKRIQSAHDIVDSNDRKLLKADGDKHFPEAGDSGLSSAKDAMVAKVHTKLHKQRQEPDGQDNREQAPPLDTSSKTLEARMMERMQNIRKEMDDDAGEGERHSAPSSSRGDKKSQLESNPEEVLAKTHSKLYMKTTAGSSGGADSYADGESRKQALRRKRKAGGVREKETLARLAKFTSSLNKGSNVPSAGEMTKSKEQECSDRQNIPAPWRVDDYLNADDEDTGDLRSHVLSFGKESRQDAMVRRDDVDDYTVYDPLLEKAKGKWSRSSNHKDRKRSRPRR